MKQIFDPDVRYICDRRKCVNCHPGCKHTDDIRHAANFPSGLMMVIFCGAEIGMHRQMFKRGTGE